MPALNPAQGPFLTGTLDVWPDAEALACTWLRSHLVGVNVRTETDATFGTPKPSAGMATPLVLVQSVASDAEHAGSRQTQHENVDITCYATASSTTASDARALVWGLHARVHAWMLRAAGQVTPAGVIDDVWLHDSIGIVPDQNPSLRRHIATYGIATRPQSQASA